MTKRKTKPVAPVIKAAALSEVDHLRLKNATLELNMARKSIQLQQQQLDSMLASQNQLNTRLVELQDEIRKRYDTGKDDEINVLTGVIQRKG